MSAPQPLEQQLLAPAQSVLDRFTSDPNARLEILEAVASSLGGFPLDTFRTIFKTTHVLSAECALSVAPTVLAAIKSCHIHPSLALCALARPEITMAQQRTSGAYYTDFRLAQSVAAAAGSRLTLGATIIDPAAGTGILLVAATLAVRERNPMSCAQWLAKSVTAWDLSNDALRGARLALASLTNDLSAVEQMVARWRCQDSLLADPATLGQFDVVLGNPPWDKVKLTRHEFMKANGGARHYGADYAHLDGASFASQRDAITRYGNELANRYPLLGGGDPDLYKAFLELFFRLARPNGCISVLVPAGLIRSQGTEHLRRFLIDNAGELSLTIMDNRARYFAIDSRFKFLGLLFTRSGKARRNRSVSVIHANGTDRGVMETGRTRMKRKDLESIRSDLTIPEVRSDDEWRLFRSLSANGLTLGSETSLWESVFIRELDMTRDSKSFDRSHGPGLIPLIEGRMVHQHRFGAKTYRNGTGRRASWTPLPLGKKIVNPQFWVPKDALPCSLRERVSSLRAGFCDITGQTNERSMLAALVPAGVVCGNKVPTVTFPNDPSENRLFLWLAIVNSIPFDWALRRLVTTTVNYFLLKNVPFPRLHPDSLPGRRIVAAARELHLIDTGVTNQTQWRVAELRASIDLAVHTSFGLGFYDLELMLCDFPLLDRGQPPLAGEVRSTVTRDFLLSRAATHFKQSGSSYADRLRNERHCGALPYIPSEFAQMEDGQTREADDVR